MSTPEVHAVNVWHEALNDGDVDRLVSLSHPDVEVGGPRGAGHGVQLLREWVDRANIRLEPLRFFHRSNTVVVDQNAEWHSADTGEVIGRQILATAFVVRGDLIASVIRYPDLTEALDATNLDESYETRSA